MGYFSFSFYFHFPFLFSLILMIFYMIVIINKKNNVLWEMLITASLPRATQLLEPWWARTKKFLRKGLPISIPYFSLLQCLLFVFIFFFPFLWNGFRLCCLLFGLEMLVCLILFSPICLQLALRIFSPKRLCCDFLLFENLEIWERFVSWLVPCNQLTTS